MMTEILDKLSHADNLPTLPTVAIEVLNITKRDDATVDELADVIQNDPALTAKLLKMVNSGLFGLPREIGSVSHAIGLLGLRTVKVLALSFSVVDAIRAPDEHGLDFEAYWRGSLTAAVTSRLLAREVAPELSEEAFVAGLLSDIGMVAAFQCDPAGYGAVIEAASSSDEPLAEMEKLAFGCSHARFSAKLLGAWGLPDLLCHAVGAHNEEGIADLTGDALRLARVVHCAALIGDLFCKDIASSELPRVKARCMRETGVTEASLEEILAALDQHVTETAKMLSVQIGATTNYAQLQSEAAKQLARLSMQAEVERTETAKREHATRIENERLNNERKQILEMAATDALTGIANRAAFDRRLEEDLRRARSRRHAVALIMLDVDHFKRFNDDHGHQVGDEVLRHVAAAIRKTIDDVGFCARYGGEEFAVILTDRSAQSLATTAERVRQAIEATRVEFEGKTLSVTASLGAAKVEPFLREVPAELLIQAADQLLYQAKHKGRNRVECAGTAPAATSASPVAAT